ncbi:MAG: GTPase Era [Chitinispirillales bacterium]|jgi:GTP-binding protein Era|nr:GTPase Era [Chitinispirillales bacterium]
MRNSAAPFKSAFIALAGRPNSGKSTLMNTVLQEQISIVTSLPQTTRRNIRGIYTTDEMQLVFIDTPGIHKGKHTFNELMLTEAQGALCAGADLICYMVDLSRDFGEEESVCAAAVSGAGNSTPVLVVFNKTDRCRDTESKINSFLSRFPEFKSYPRITISAVDPRSKKVFLDTLLPFINEGPKYFDDDSLTDASMRTLAAEFIRKQVILNTREEVPHAVFVEIESYKETDAGHKITAAIHVETDGQKAIVIGKRGALIEKIKKDARREIETLAGVRVSLKAHIKITPNWRNDNAFLRSMQ